MRRIKSLRDNTLGTKKGLNRGDKFNWDVYFNVGTQGRRLDESAPIPETGFQIRQGQLTVYEAGNSVPYTGKLASLAKHQIESVIDKTLKDDSRKYFDIECFLQFKQTPLRFNATSGTSTTAITLDTNGTCSTTNNVALGTGHVKACVDTMKERNIPQLGGLAA